MPTSNQVPLPECVVRFDGGIGAAMTVKMIAHNENKMMDSLYMLMRGGMEFYSHLPLKCNLQGLI